MAELYSTCNVISKNRIDVNSAIYRVICTCHFTTSIHPWWYRYIYISLRTSNILYTSSEVAIG